MTTLLALIMSALIALSGAGALPAIPETATQITVRDFSVSINDETYDIESEPVVTAALGTDLIAGEFAVRLGDDVLMPIRGTIDQDAIRLALGDTDRVYTLNQDTIAELMGCDEDASALIESYLAEIVAMRNLDLTTQAMMSLESLKVLAGTLSKSESAAQTTLNGKSVPITSYSGLLTVEAIAKLLDSLTNSEVPAISAYMNNLLKAANRIDGTNYAGFGEAFAAAAATEALPDMNINIDIAEDGDSHYVKTELTIDVAEIGETLSITSEQILDGGDLRNVAKGTINAGGTVITIDFDMATEDASGDAPGMHFDICTSFAEAIDGDNQEIADIALTYSEQKVNDLFSCGLDLSIDFDLMQRVSYAAEDGPTAAISRDPQHITFSFGADEAAAENGGKDCTVAMTLYMNNGSVYTVSFVVNTATVPFDAAAMFADSDEAVLTGAQNDPAMMKMLTDVIATLKDIDTVIAEDQGAADLVNLFAEVLKSAEM